MVLADTGYAAGETLAALGNAHHRAAIKPWPLHSAVPGGFDRDDFVIDHDAGAATCPAGHRVTITPKLFAVFRAHCRGCALRERCTTAKSGRFLTLTPHDRELVAQRASWRSGEFTEYYRKLRPMVERSIAWLVADRHRRVRFRGVEKNQLGLSLALRQSTSGAWSTSGCPTREAGRSGPGDHRRVSLGRQNGTSPLGSAHPGWPALTHSHTGASVGHTQACTHRIYAREAVCSTVS